MLGTEPGSSIRAIGAEPSLWPLQLFLQVGSFVDPGVNDWRGSQQVLGILQSPPPGLGLQTADSEPVFFPSKDLNSGFL